MDDGVITMEDNKKSKLEKIKQGTAKSAVAVAASAGVLLGGLFHSPADLLKDPAEIDRALAPPAIELVIQENDEDPEPDPAGDGGTEQQDEEEEEKRRGFRAFLRRLILKAPKSVRAAVGIPLWAAGWGLIALFSGLWSAVLSPLAGTILGWIVVAAVILLCIIGTVKAVLPDLPVRKILNRKTILIVVCGIAICAGADALLPLVWTGYEAVRNVLRITGATAVLITGSTAVFRHEKKSKKTSSQSA